MIDTYCETPTNLSIKLIRPVGLFRDHEIYNNFVFRDIPVFSSRAGKHRSVGSSRRETDEIDFVGRIKGSFVGK